MSNGIQTGFNYTVTLHVYSATKVQPMSKHNFKIIIIQALLHVHFVPFCNYKQHTKLLYWLVK